MKKTTWLNLKKDERKAILQNVSDTKHIPDYAVEKDWWVTAVLKALMLLDCSRYLSFKGGTSLSKGWNLIQRFSEDIDIALSHRFFRQPVENNNQLKKLRKSGRRYIDEVLSKQLEKELSVLGFSGFSVHPVLEKNSIAVSSDADPSIIMVDYESVSGHQSQYVPSSVKIEISCLSMDEPVENKTIKTLISNMYPEIEQDTSCIVPTVIPSRTFLEKAFLLSEEFQKVKPRSLRMSRHLYDLEKLMDTDFAKEALKDKNLYEAIVEHRMKFYHVGYADYRKDLPDMINFIPPSKFLGDWASDYKELLSHFVYGQGLSFKELIKRIRTLQQRFRNTDIQWNIHP